MKIIFLSLCDALVTGGIGQMPDETPLADGQPLKAIHIQDARDKVK